MSGDDLDAHWSDELENYWEDVASLDGVDLTFLDDATEGNIELTVDVLHQHTQATLLWSPRTARDADKSQPHKCTQPTCMESPRLAQEPIPSSSNSHYHQQSLKSSTTELLATSTDSESEYTRVTAVTEESMIVGFRDLNGHMAYIPISAVYVPSSPLHYVSPHHVSQTHSTPSS